MIRVLVLVALVMGGAAGPLCAQGLFDPPGNPQASSFSVPGQQVGDLLTGDTATSVTGLHDVATGSALLSGGVGALPAYGKVGLTTHVSGVLPTANGGTGANATPTTDRYLKGNGSWFGTSNGAASGTGACAASRWASTLNSDAAPTCTQPAASDLSNGTTGAGAVALATSPTLQTSWLINKVTAAGTAPGAGTARFEVVAGTNPGTCKLQMYAGTSATPVTVLDNVGAGC